MHGILGGRWKRRHASRTEAHGESRGYATGRYSGRASAQPQRRLTTRGSPLHPRYRLRTGGRRSSTVASGSPFREMLNRVMAPPSHVNAPAAEPWP